MNLELVDSAIRWLGGLAGYSALGILLFGIWRGTLRPVGRASGRTASWLRSVGFYFISTALFLGASYLVWKPLPFDVRRSIRIWMLIAGAGTYFPGVWFVLWGRLALGKNYFVSTGSGAQLFREHQLVTTGPYAIVRHPMYTGLLLAAFGSLLIYFTYTTLIYSCFAPLVALRARREEALLAEEFGEKWQRYSRCVPAFLPRFKS